MALKSILVPATGPEKLLNCFDVALMLQKQFHAAITTIHAKPDPMTAIPYFGEGVGADIIHDLSEKAEQENNKFAEETKAWFSHYFSSRGLDDSQWRWVEKLGFYSEVLGASARVADLSIVPQPTDHAPDDVNSFLVEALYQSGKAALMVPTGYHAQSLNNIMIAWNGTMECARAVTAALPLLARAQSVKVVSVEEVGGHRPDLEEIENYLKDHDVDAHCQRVHLSEDDVARQIIHECEQASANMLVMGAYSHNRLKEYILGGVTRSLINDITIPVLFYH